MKIINNLNVLRAMAARGLIKLDSDTGKKVWHWAHREATAHYVNDGPREFEYKGKKYGVRYFDGCFKPFVVLLDGKPGPQFV